MDQASCLELAQQIGTGSFSETAVGLAPIPDAAKAAGKVRAAALSLRQDECADPLENFGANPPLADDQFLCHGVIGAKGMTRRQNYFRKQYDEHLRVLAFGGFTLETGWSWAYTQFMQVEKSSDRRNRRADGARSGRRQFLAQLTGLAAATALASKPAAAAGAESAPPAAPLPTMQLGPHRISRLVAGSNPILGYSYLGPHTDLHLKEYFTVERTVEFLENCERAGITAHQFADPERALPYLRRLRERGSKLQFICLHAQREKIRQAIDLTQPMAMVHHGGVTDQLFAEGKAGVVHDYVKAAHDAGVLAGVSAHNPDCIQRIADAGWEVDFFMTCFYFLTRQRGKEDVGVPTLEIAYPFYKDDPKVMTEVVRQVKQPCLGFKILGAGRLCADQPTVRRAFQFAFENIKPTDGVIVGMFPWCFDEVSANAEYTRELGKAASSRAPA